MTKAGMMPTIEEAPDAAPCEQLPGVAAPTATRYLEDLPVRRLRPGDVCSSAGWPMPPPGPAISPTSPSAAAGSPWSSRPRTGSHADRGRPGGGGPHPAAGGRPPASRSAGPPRGARATGWPASSMTPRWARPARRPGPGHPGDEPFGHASRSGTGWPAHHRRATMPTMSEAGRRARTHTTGDAATGVTWSDIYESPQVDRSLRRLPTAVPGGGAAGLGRRAARAAGRAGHQGGQRARAGRGPAARQGGARRGDRRRPQRRRGRRRSCQGCCC